MCGAPVRLGFWGGVWHALSSWHNPFGAYAQARAAGVSGWLIAGVVGGVSVGIFLLGAMLPRVWD